MKHWTHRWGGVIMALGVTLCLLGAGRPPLPNTLTIYPTAWGIVHPERPWSRTVTVTSSYAKPVVMRSQVFLVEGDHTEPIPTPSGLHLPASFVLDPQQSQTVTVSATHMSGVGTLAIGFLPSLPHQSGIGVVGGIALTLFLGHATAPQFTIHTLQPWISGSGVTHVTVQLHNTGKTWVVPVIRLPGDSHLIRMPLLLPGHTESATVSLASGGFSLGAHPLWVNGRRVEVHFLTVPGRLLMAMGAGAVVVVVIEMVGRRRRPPRRLDRFRW